MSQQLALAGVIVVALVGLSIGFDLGGVTGGLSGLTGGGGGSNGGGGLVDTAAGLVGTGIGGLWSQAVPASTNRAAIKAACKGGKVKTKNDAVDCVCKCVENAEDAESGGAVNSLLGTAGSAIGTAWSTLVPGSTNYKSIVAACKGGNVDDECLCGCVGAKVGKKKSKAKGGDDDEGGNTGGSDDE